MKQYNYTVTIDHARIKRNGWDADNGEQTNPSGVNYKVFVNNALLSMCGKCPAEIKLSLRKRISSPQRHVETNGGLLRGVTMTVQYAL